MAESCEAGIPEQKAPSRREIGVFGLASPNPPDQIHEPDHNCRNQWNSQEGVCKAAMMLESKSSSPVTPKNVKVGGLSG